MKAADALISEKLELKNYLYDNMEMQIMRELVIKPRHQMLFPL